MTITQFGRVELDLARIPTPSAPPVAEANFDRRLEAAAGRQVTTERVQSETAAQERVETPAGEAAVPARATRSTAEGAAGGPEGEAGAGPALAAGRTEGAALVEGEPRDASAASREAAVAPKASTELPAPAPARSAPALAAQGPMPEPTAPTNVRAPGSASPEPTQSRAQGQTGEARALTAAERPARPSARGAALRRAASYKSLGKQALQLGEQARDSVFKQILLRVRPEGGEARFLLDPPELGRIDLRVVVENGALRLAIATERPELAAALQRHMGELGDALASRGLAVADAHVQARDGRSAEWGSGRHPWRGASRGRNDDDALDESAPARTPARGFVRADGLDFWV